MLIPIGFFGGAAGGSYELISTANGNGSSNTISFSSIPSTYKHIEIRGRIFTNSGTGIGMQLNGDGGGNYMRHLMVSEPNQGSIRATYVFNQDRFNVAGYNAGANSTYGLAIILNINDFTSTVKTKTFRSVWGVETGSAATSENGFYTGVWNSTAGVNSLSIIASADAFTSNTRLSLYGIKG